MLFVRTEDGGFVNAATIVRLCEETDGWVAICDDDREVALAAYFYGMPGRLKDLQHLLPPRDISSSPHPPAAACGCDCAF